MSACGGKLQYLPPPPPTTLFMLVCFHALSTAGDHQQESTALFKVDSIHTSIVSASTGLSTCALFQPVNIQKTGITQTNEHDYWN
jgi:hypothetical protein